ncbi:hypothetical protein BDZ91DRAFT_655307 [Kalaharituber pfeilii]|nr:hypothetical protein BDZ91DRAFT_655307 [Kalaharituber pfeilii]
MTKDQVGMATSIGVLETFELIRHPDGMVSFKSTSFPDTYLSADGSNVQSGSSNAGGYVGCSNTCGSREKFWIHWSANAKVGIQPADFPGRFLMMDESTNYAIRVQGVKLAWELFYIVLVK